MDTVPHSKNVGVRAPSYPPPHKLRLCAWPLPQIPHPRLEADDWDLDVKCQAHSTRNAFSTALEWIGAWQMNPRLSELASCWFGWGLFVFRPASRCSVRIKTEAVIKWLAATSQASISSRRRREPGSGSGKIKTSAAVRSRRAVRGTSAVRRRACSRRWRRGRRRGRSVTGLNCTDR